MEFVVLSDIHANYPALRAVLTDFSRTADGIICLGDVVGYGPDPAACVRALRDIAPVATVRGNHDDGLRDLSLYDEGSLARLGLEHAAEELDVEQRAWVTTRPFTQTVGAGEILLSHGHPDPNIPVHDNASYVLPRHASELVPYTDDYNLILLGHTHIQMAKDLSKWGGGTGMVVNPGSVGSPRDDDPRPGYAVVSLDDSTGEIDVELRRVTYDTEDLYARVGAAGLPVEIAEKLADPTRKPTVERRHNPKQPSD